MEVARHVRPEDHVERYLGHEVKSCDAIGTFFRTLTKENSQIIEKQ